MAQDKDKPDDEPALDFDDRPRLGAAVTKSFDGRRPAAKANPWNSLEVAKIIVGALTPLLIACLGVYITWDSHRQDAQRLAHEDLRSRKAAALPAILELERTDRQFMADTNTIRFNVSFHLSGSTMAAKNGAVVFGDFQRAVAAHDEKVAEIWARLQPLVDDRAAYAELHGLYEERIERQYVRPLNACTTRFIVLAYTQGGKSSDPVGCMSGVADDNARACAAYLTERLENFEQPSASFAAAASSCPALLPRRSGASSAP